MKSLNGGNILNGGYQGLKSEMAENAQIMKNLCGGNPPIS